MATLNWQIATVTALHDETPHVKTMSLLVPGWQNHRPGQHVDIRLTAEDGYQAQRSYSIGSAPNDQAVIDLTVERVTDGEVSPFLHDEVVLGDKFEVRGPIGGYFVWDGSSTDPLLLVAGGSGIVPLMAMVRQRAQTRSAAPCTMLYSSRTPGDIIYSDELERLGAHGDGLRVAHTLTRSQPPGWTGYSRRIDRQMLTDVLGGTGSTTQVFVCGPTPLVESVAEGLVNLGLTPSQVRTERFGPSGA
ncbi:MAG: ferredoxin reductase [Candidatus Limnocylindrales bacterium]